MRSVSFNAAMQKKYPEWIVLVATVDRDGTPDVMPAGWAMIASHNPPMFAIAVGHTRYTHELIRRQGEFVVAFPGPALGEAIEYTGSRSGRREKEKVRRAGLEVLEADVVAPPLLGGCSINLECTLAGELEAGDHTIFLGQVEAAHVDDEIETHLVNFQGTFAPAVRADE